MTRYTSVTFTPPAVNTSPGSWHIEPEDAPDLDHGESRQYQYDLSATEGWTYVAVSMHLRDDQTSKSYEPFITVRQGMQPSASYTDLNIAIVEFSNTKLLLEIKNKNTKDTAVYLGMALTVGGTLANSQDVLFRTSHDPQIRLRKSG